MTLFRPTRSTRSPAEPIVEGSASVLAVDDLTVRYGRNAPAVDHVSFTVETGQFAGIVGESGSGKSTVLKSIMRLLPDSVTTTGSIRFQGRDLVGAPEAALRGVRGTKLSMIFQDPVGVFNPSFTIGYQLDRILRIRRPELTKAQRHSELIDMLDRVSVPGAQKLRNYPFEFSQGQLQRIALVAACLGRQMVMLLADEPTTSLDVTMEAQLMALIQELRADLGLTILFVSHDIALVAEHCDRLLVMYAGHLVEDVAVTSMLDNLSHPYTKELLKSVPAFPSDERRLYAMRGELSTSQTASPTATAGCCFADRCPSYLGPICDTVAPALLPTGTGGVAACHLMEPPASAPGSTTQEA
jgi:oligopeptide/dipeptide ABC transporter ATP-binding protein